MPHILTGLNRVAVNRKKICLATSGSINVDKVLYAPYGKWRFQERKQRESNRRGGQIEMISVGQWNGPYMYRKITMNVKVLPNRIGNYMLGYIAEDGKFVPKYVGRSDHDLQGRLIKHITDGEEYETFVFKYARTVKEAYETECRNYHNFKEQLVNERHPDRPDYFDYDCPVCGK